MNYELRIIDILLKTTFFRTSIIYNSQLIVQTILLEFVIKTNRQKGLHSISLHGNGQAIKLPLQPKQKQQT